MKKTTYTASVYYLKDGEQQKFENLSAENAEAINAQAHAGLDLHWFMENEGTMYEFLIPWEAVLSVAIQKVVTDETAPTDTICGGGETTSALVVTPKTPIDSVEIVHQPGGHCTVPAGWYTIESVTLNGEPVNLDTFYANMTERFEYSGETVNCDEHGCSLVVDCDATSVTYTHIFTYEGESCTLTITQNIKPSNG